MVLLSEGKKASHSGDALTAETNYKKVLELDPKNAEAYLLLGRLRFDEQKLDDALAFVNKAIECSPEYGEAYRTRGQIHFIQQKLIEACEDFKLAQKYGVKNLRNQLQICR